MITYTLVELASLTSGNKTLAIWVPGHTGQAVFMGLAHFGSQFPCLIEHSGNLKERRPCGKNLKGDSRSVESKPSPERSTAKAQSSRLGHRLSDTCHQGSRPDRKPHRHDPLKSSAVWAGEFPVKTSQKSLNSRITASMLHYVIKERKDTHRINLPYNDCRVFGSRGQFGAVVGEFTEPDFIAVLGQNLLGVAGELFPRDNSKCT